MKFHKDSKAKFIHFFGEGALRLVNIYPDVNFIMAERGMFPMIDAYGTPSGAVIPVDMETLELLPEDESKRELALIIYPEHVDTGVDQLPAQLRDRNRVSTLIHELTHIKQAVEGRLKIVKEGHMIWEGEDYFMTGIDMVAYVQYPWEREAYIEQLAYLTGGNGEEAYKHVVIAQKQAAAAKQ